eukprot:TRINITY_DN11852_c0_g1_i1.p1 TRINITY_DN11852_c0_g1~~TRINITY_DN11852_c0_g1_i1.p1  ORF type:complete len:228 (+),score=30.90 TRINITY_DN11852_c0_g1_i1:174-857(+)
MSIVMSNHHMSHDPRSHFGRSVSHEQMRKSVEEHRHSPPPTLSNSSNDHHNRNGRNSPNPSDRPSSKRQKTETTPPSELPKLPVLSSPHFSRTQSSGTVSGRNKSGDWSNGSHENIPHLNGNNSNDSQLPQLFHSIEPQLQNQQPIPSSPKIFRENSQTNLFEDKHKQPSHHDILRRHDEEYKAKQAKRSAVAIANSRFANYYELDSFHDNYVLPCLPTFETPQSGE